MVKKAGEKKREKGREGKSEASEKATIELEKKYAKRIGIGCLGRSTL
jgi:hypothetical protein